MKHNIYIAGPLFSEADRAFDVQIAAVCESLDFTTFLPHRDAQVRPLPENATRLFLDNVLALDRADLVVANLDGVDVDSGTAWEIGRKFGSDGLIIGIRTDLRPSELGLRVNLMIARSVHSLVTTLDELRCALLEWKSAHDPQ